MSRRNFQHVLANGMTLLAEEMTHVRSAALNFLVPAGTAYDPPSQVGLASCLSEMIVRGAGDRSSRELTQALDNLGLDRSESVSQLHMRFWGATVARNIPAALEIYADILRRPHLPADELPAAQSLALQDIQAIEDDPNQKLLIELRRRFWPHPLGRDRRGTPATIAALTPEAVRRQHRKLFGPRGTILSVAGHIDWPALKDQVERLFGDWEPAAPVELKLKKPVGGKGHLDKDTEQTSIAVAFPSVPFGHPDYYAAVGAVQVLSGGMGARLFTEVREKRGLAYSVSASYSTFKEHACVLCYAGTGHERAQETLEVILQELDRLQEGVTEEEVQRVRAGLKSGTIMQEESTSARAGALANDWYYLGRIRPREEIQAAIDGLTPKKILQHIRKHPPADFVVVTLGREPLRLPRSAPRTTTV